MTTEKKLHIVSFNIPYPPNYVGVIDVFYKLKALSENGVKIILHTFEYGREQAPELEQYCEKVYYYKRKTGFLSQLSTLPYIVYSRRNKELYANLLKNDYPILFEGLHTCFYLNDPAFKDRLKLVRVHNIEHDYYRGLVKKTSSLGLKIYFKWEAFRLKGYAEQLNSADYLLALSTRDEEYLKSVYKKPETLYLPLFFSQKGVQRREPKPFVLFHGDLSNWENINAANFLIRSVASLDEFVPWVFAGLNPHPSLLQLAKSYGNVSIWENLSEEEMNQLLSEAKINILYTDQRTGAKLKLLNVLYKSWYCLATEEMTDGSGLEELCETINGNPGQILRIIKNYMLKPFPKGELERRERYFDTTFNNNKNAEKIKSLLE